MITMFHGLRYLTINDWMWLAAKIVSGLGLPAAVLVNSYANAPVRNNTVSLWALSTLMGLMVAGAILSMTGILLRGTRTKPAIFGYSLEIGGLIMLTVGPLFLGGIYLVSALASGGSLTGTALCFALAVPYVARLTDISVHHLASKRDHESRRAKTRRLRNQGVE